jgi:hypothetical protein
MLQLILSRCVQGLGAGCIIPLSMTIVGELYTLAERPRTQALFSGVWGVASIAGPLVGGYVTDYLNWRWVFFLNLPFGCWPRGHRVRLSGLETRGIGPGRLAGAGLMFSGISTLLIALGDETPAACWVWVLRRRAAGGVRRGRTARAEPILPLDLFGTPVIARSLAVVFLVGVALSARSPSFRCSCRPCAAERPRRRAGHHAAVSGLGGHVDCRRQGDGAVRLSNGLDHRQRPDDDRIRRPDARPQRLAAMDPPRQLYRHRSRNGNTNAVAAAGRPTRRRSIPARHRDCTQSVFAQRRRGDWRGGHGRRARRAG